jgi:hypothetical protein
MMISTITRHDIIVIQSPLRADDAPENGGSDDSLDDAARREQDYLRQRLRDELGREPSEDELNEWLREHTEGY